MTYSRTAYLPFMLLLLTFLFQTIACENSAPHASCPDCPPGFFCAPDGQCRKPCNVVAECDVCEMCSQGLCLPKVGRTEGNEQDCSQDKTCDNPNQICVNNDGDLVCADRATIQIRPGTFESTQPSWQTKEFLLRGNIAPITGRSSNDNYSAHPSSN